ncbi:MAG: DisA bacterial checkpoint controller nucleotide-binding protein [Planctomycetes bacterium ADurb.Bin412]|nr:MAG: DisA bacterial checkpoint controller nucleotide-binding protein [Planctomycetes bacterium ADurb.Bin412]
MWQAVRNYLDYLYHSYAISDIVLEVALIGMVVYSVIRFLRGTGGEKLLKGIVFLLLGFWLVNWLTNKLELERIGFLFNSFLVGVLVVAAVAFQSELRRGLMQLGETRLSRTAAPEMEQVIEQIVDTAAIIDGKVTSALLNTIFWPGSPLHDMAVVIRRGKLAAAAVQLPLAEHGEYDRLLGSRHRSAIGLSKATDAVVVVISEETGNIGIAMGGKLNRFLTIEQLRQQLLDVMMPITRQKEGWLGGFGKRGRNKAAPPREKAPVQTVPDAAEKKAT